MLRPKEYQKGSYVDTAVIGRKKMFLPRSEFGAGSGEVSKATCSYMEKSAEVIVLTGNELVHNPRGLTSKEGQNVRSRLDSCRNPLIG